MFAYPLDRVSVVLVVEKASCLIRLARVNNGGGDPASVSPTVRIVRLYRKPPESKRRKRKPPFPGSAERYNGRGRARSRHIATIEMVIFDSEAV